MSAILNEDESLHCVKVLRHKVGDIIRVIDGNGTVAVGKIEAAHAKQCAVSLVSKELIKPSRNYHLHIAIAPTKNIERTEWFVEKAVEIGIDEISLIRCKNSERTIVKEERLRKVAEAAVKQSQQAYLPVLNPLIDFKEFLKKESTGIKLIAHCVEEEKRILKEFITVGQSFTVLIGPEGDFSKDEISMALTAGFQPVTFGKSRLRTETAGLFACNAFAAINC
jgi:16S rRNA (uracil1498-N3)-methyltransferase